MIRPLEKTVWKSSDSQLFRKIFLTSCKSLQYVSLSSFVSFIPSSSFVSRLRRVSKSLSGFVVSIWKMATIVIVIVRILRSIHFVGLVVCVGGVLVWMSGVIISIVGLLLLLLLYITYLYLFLKYFKVRYFKKLKIVKIKTTLLWSILFRIALRNYYG